MPSIPCTSVPVALRLAWFVALLLSIADQADGQQVGAATDPPLVEARELTTHFFKPKHLDARQTFRLADSLYGRNIYLVERGGYGEDPVRNLQTLGDTLIIYDLDDQAQRIGEALHALDNQAEDSTQQPVPDIIVTEWSPGYIPLQAGMAAIESLKRIVHTVDDSGLVQEAWNITMSKDNPVIVLRDTPRQIEQIVGLLERLDHPEPQLLLSCLVIRGVHGEVAGADKAPAELSQHLAQLVPYESFEVVSRGIVRSSARTRSIELKIDASFRLELRPEAYDAETRSLTAQCQFVGANGFGFETRTTLNGAEYTVLGATGREPIFAVLRIEQLD